MKKMNLEQMKLQISADRDVRKTVALLQEHFDRKIESNETSNKEISMLTGIDPSVISRLINGRTGNPTLLTVAKVFRALNLRLAPQVEDVRSIECSRINSTVQHKYDGAVRDREIMHLTIPRTTRGGSSYWLSKDNNSRRSANVSYSNAHPTSKEVTHG